MRSWRSRLSLTLAASPGLPLAVVAVAVLVWFAGDEGGFRGTTFLLGGVILLGALVIGLVVLPRPAPPRMTLIAIALLVGYALWSYLSMLWADQEALAWDGANRTVLYAIVFALFALWPMRGGPAAFVVGAFGLGVATIGLVELIRVDGAEKAIDYLHEGRLTEPVGYVNANVALWFSACLACAILAGRRGVPAPLRGLLLGGAGILLAATILGQSRGWLFVLPVAVVLAVALVPGRGRTLVTLAVLALATLLMLDPLLNVYDSFDPEGPPGAAYSDALRTALLVSGGLLVAAWLAALADDRVEVADRIAHRVSGGLLAAACVVALAGAVAFTVVEGSPVAKASDAWEEFKEGGSSGEADRTRFDSSLATYRYDYWRVAWEEFESRPLTGIGADNFGVDYLREGESTQTPNYPHSVVLRTIAQTGLIGLLLLGGALVAALVAAWPAIRAGGGIGGAAAGAGLTVFAYWLVHGSLDWLWEFAALGGAAFALLGLATAIAAARRPQMASRGFPRGTVAAAVGAGLAVLVGLGLAMPWLAERDLRHGREVAADDPEAALESFDRSRQLNPFSPLPDQAAGLVELSRRNYAEGEARLRDALEREPEDPFTYLQLAAVASVRMREGEAVKLAERAHRLAPRDVVAAAVLRRLRAGNLVSPARLNALIREDFEVRLGPE